MLASGGNDNKLFIWDLRNPSDANKAGGRSVHRGRLSTTPFYNLSNPSSSSAPQVDSAPSFGGEVVVSPKADTSSPLLQLTEHRAAVRGLAWSPHTRGLLASGGGRQDPIIRFWNTSIGYKIDQLQCHAQVRLVPSQL